MWSIKDKFNTIMNQVKWQTIYIQILTILRVLFFDIPLSLQISNLLQSYGLKLEW